MALLPFSTDLMSDYDEAPEAAAVFAAHDRAGLADALDDGALLGAARLHARRDAPSSRSPRGWALPFVFLASIPAAYIDTGIAQLMWIGGAFLHYPLRRAAGRGSETSS